MRIDNYERNTKGRDFFVGDIHGCYDKLMAALHKVGFDMACDVLYSVGDLVDRGPDSLKCLGLIERPWFRSIKGNHEQIMIDATRKDVDHPSQKWESVSMWVNNGGTWYRELPEALKGYAARLISLANELPNGVRVGDIGVVHAECPLPDWDLLAIDQGNLITSAAMWSRTRENYGIKTLVEGVSAVVVGHTPVKEPKVLGNHVYIDTGACFYADRELTILSYNEIIALVNSREE